jgi:hypothetical protein
MTRARGLKKSLDFTADIWVDVDKKVDRAAGLRRRTGPGRLADVRLMKGRRECSTVC